MPVVRPEGQPRHAPEHRHAGQIPAMWWPSQIFEQAMLEGPVRETEARQDAEAIEQLLPGAGRETTKWDWSKSILEMPEVKKRLPEGFNVEVLRLQIERAGVSAWAGSSAYSYRNEMRDEVQRMVYRDLRIKMTPRNLLLKIMQQFATMQGHSMYQGWCKWTGCGLDYTVPGSQEFEFVGTEPKLDSWGEAATNLFDTRYGTELAVTYVALMTYPDICPHCVLAGTGTGQRKDCVVMGLFKGRWAFRALAQTQTLAPNGQRLNESITNNPVCPECFAGTGWYSTMAACGHRACNVPGCGQLCQGSAGSINQMGFCAVSCEEHCECMPCNNCGRVTGRNTNCPTSEHCGACCHHPPCPIPANRMDAFKVQPFEVRNLKDQRRTKLKRLLGAEIEICGMDKYTPELKAVFSKWKPHPVRDGSLPATGIEIPTQPAGGDRWLDMIGDVAGQLTKDGAYAGSQAGCHIHVDARDLTTYDLRRTVRLYAYLEKELYAVIHPMRATGTYSTPCGPTLLEKVNNLQKGLPIKTAVEANFYNLNPKSFETRVGANGKKQFYNPQTDSWETDTPEMRAKVLNEKIKQNKAHKGGGHRYYGLNLQSFFFRQTLEFRHHHGTVDPVKIINWGQTVGSIVEWASTHTDIALKRLTEDKSPAEALYSIVEECTMRPEIIHWLKARKAFFKENAAKFGRESSTGWVGER